MRSATFSGMQCIQLNANFNVQTVPSILWLVPIMKDFTLHHRNKKRKKKNLNTNFLFDTISKPSDIGSPSLPSAIIILPACICETARQPQKWFPYYSYSFPCRVTISNVCTQDTHKYTQVHLHIFVNKKHTWLHAKSNIPMV